MSPSTKTVEDVSLRQPPARQPKSREEMLEIFRAVREEVRAANPTGRNLLAELLEERRQEALND